MNTSFLRFCGFQGTTNACIQCTQNALYECMQTLAKHKMQVFINPQELVHENKQNYSRLLIMLSFFK